MSDFELQHGRHVWKDPRVLDAAGIFDQLRTSRPRWRVIAGVLPSEQDAAVDAAVFLALIEEGVYSPIDSRKSSAIWKPCACRLSSDIKPKLNFEHGHRAGLGHACNVFQCAGSAEGVRQLMGLLRRSYLLTRSHLYIYTDEDLVLALTWLLWEAWDRLFKAVDDAAEAWAHTLPGVVAELRSMAMSNVIHAKASPETSTAPSRRRSAMGV